jgi:hypothetical protein
MSGRVLRDLSCKSTRSLVDRLEKIKELVFKDEKQALLRWRGLVVQCVTTVRTAGLFDLFRDIFSAYPKIN